MNVHIAYIPASNSYIYEYEDLMYINPSAQLQVAVSKLYVPSIISCYIFEPREKQPITPCLYAKYTPKYTATLCLARSNQSSVLLGPLVDPVNGSLVIALTAIITLELERRRSASRDGLQVV